MNGILKLFILCVLYGTSILALLYFFNLNSFLLFAGWVLILAIIFRVSIFVTASYINYRKGLRPVKFDRRFKPFVSVLSPCYNEEKTLRNAVIGLVDQSYSNMEVIIIDDGSKDNTKEVGEALAKEYPNLVRFYRKKNGGKANALNYGLSKARGSIIVSMDADAIFERDTVKHLVSSFQDPTVMAVSGNVKISNRDNFLGLSQTMECIVGLQLQTRSFSELGCIQVIPGSLGAFRRWMLEDVGGFPNDTIVEDMDLTIMLQERFWRYGYRIVFNNRAVSYVEEPENFKDFLKQRYRWMYGWFQVQDKHRQAFFNPEFGAMGMFGFPYFVISPVLNLVMIVFTIAVIASAVITGLYLNFGLYFLGGALLILALTLYAIYIDGYREKRTMSLVAIPQNIWYLFVLNYVYIKAGLDHALGRSTTWNKVTRLGKNHMRFSQTREKMSMV